jgi:hypothetical protein
VGVAVLSHGKTPTCPQRTAAIRCDPQWCEQQHQYDADTPWQYLGRKGSPTPATLRTERFVFFKDAFFHMKHAGHTENCQHNLKTDAAFALGCILWPKRVQQVGHGV